MGEIGVGGTPTHLHHPTMKPYHVAYIALLVATLLLFGGVYLFATTPVATIP